MTEQKQHSTQELLQRVERAFVHGLKPYNDEAREALRQLQEQLEAERELVEEARRFALVLADLRVRTRPFAEVWLQKYRATHPYEGGSDADTATGVESEAASPDAGERHIADDGAVSRSCSSANQDQRGHDSSAPHLQERDTAHSRPVGTSNPAISPESPCSICRSYGHFTHNHPEGYVNPMYDVLGAEHNQDQGQGVE